MRTIRDEIANACLGADRFRAPGDRTLAAPLPRSLDAVVRSAERRRPEIRDPETGEPYGYEVVNETTIRLCATFRFERDERRDPLWNHPAGPLCFEFDLLKSGPP